MIAVLLAALIVLAALVATRFPGLVTLDHLIVAITNAALVARPGLITATRIVTDLGSPVSVDVLTGVAVVLMLVRRRVRAAVYLVAVRVVELGIETGLKYAIDRPRPAEAAALVTASNSSFPSGHAAGTATLCVSLLLCTSPPVRRTTRVVVVIVAAVICLAVATSRVALGVHYPSDVLAGLVLGSLCALALRPILGSTGPAPPQDSAPCQ